MTSFQFPANRTSRSWKPRRWLATLSLADCRADPRLKRGSKNMCRKVARQICIRNNRRRKKPTEASRRSRVTACKEGLTSKRMIGQGIQSTNQRKHSYVQDRVEVGFFTDPSVCIGCKACEVACKEWNHVPDDGFT